MALILLDGQKVELDNTPESWRYQQARSIASQMIAKNSKLVTFSGIEIAGQSEQTERASANFCAHCHNAISGDVFCSPCAQVVKNRAPQNRAEYNAFVAETRQVMKVYFIGCAFGAALIWLSLYFVN